MFIKAIQANSESDSDLSETSDDDLGESGDGHPREIDVNNENSSNDCMNYAEADNSVIIVEQEDVTVLDISDIAEETNIEFSEASESTNSSYISVIETDFDVAASEVHVVSCPETTDEFESPRQTGGARDALSLYSMLAAATEDVGKPKSYEEARQYKEKKEWKVAMNMNRWWRIIFGSCVSCLLAEKLLIIDGYLKSSAMQLVVSNATKLGL